jgi:hypothetical protein
MVGVFMIVPVRNAYSRRVAGSRVAAGARNIAQTSDTPFIETAAESKRTGAQEESLLHEGADERTDDSVALDAPAEADGQSPRRKQLAGLIDHSLAWDERLRAAAKAYRYTVEKLDKTRYRIKPGDVYDAPF